MKKAAVIFPGIGYHTDKPLLYYSKKIAAHYGFDIIEVPYGNFPKGIKGSKEKMQQAFTSALSQAEEILKEADLGKYDALLFISKSIGTAVASAYAEKKRLSTKNIFYTPVEESLEWMTQPGVVFHGTRDPWAETEPLIEGCKKKGYPLHLIENANHSLETGDVLSDIKNLERIMAITEEYIFSIFGNIDKSR